MLMLGEKPILYYAAYTAPYGKPAPACCDDPAVLSNPDAGSDFLDEYCSLLGVSENEAPLRICRDGSGVYRIDLELTDDSYLDMERGKDYSLLIRGYDSPEAAAKQGNDHTSQVFAPYATFLGRSMPPVGPVYDDEDEGEAVQFKCDCTVECTPCNDGGAVDPGADHAERRS